MSLKGILIYSARAAAFAAAACAVYALICLLCRKKLRLKVFLGTAYIAALIQITVLRGGVDWQKLLAGARDMPRLVPFGTTVELLDGDVWSLIYNIAGNLLWFVPLGLLLGKGSVLRALLLGAALSAAIEISQYILMTGLRI
ncbi:MAG: VanZ family protein [Clostridia bacterium]|nr:VanZ family protein [Clostridia bacterium]